MRNTISTAILASGWTILAIAFLVSAFIAANWFFYSEARRSFEDEFGKRLAALASMVSYKIESRAPEAEKALYFTAPASDFENELRNIQEENSLSNIFLLREDFVTILSLEEDLYPKGSEYPHWKMDYDAIQKALGGRSTATALHRHGGRYLAAGYAPLRLGSSDAVVGVEASARFLESIDRLRFLLVAVTGISAAGVALFAIFAVKAASSLLKARESLAKAETLVAMGRMTAGIAHEIRNPLFIIRSGAEKLLAKHPDSEGPIREYILEEVDRLSSILEDYLSFAKEEPLKVREMDLVPCLRRTVRNVRSSLGESVIEIEENYMLAKAPMVGEEKRLEQVFLNVLLNASQAIEGKGKISVTLGSRDGKYLVQIADTGKGIQTKELEKIFEPFYTTKPQGSGLGLSIARRVIESHRGKIEVESSPGKGTTVSIVLPGPSQDSGGAMENGGRIQ